MIVVKSTSIIHFYVTAVKVIVSHGNTSTQYTSSVKLFLNDD